MTPVPAPGHDEGVPPTLLSWLTTLDADELSTCLRLRPDVLWGVPVADLEDLAERLEHPASVTHAITGLAAPWLAVLEVVTALGDGASVEAVARLLDGSTAPDSHDADVRAVIDGMISAALVVPGQGGVLAVNPGARAVFTAPLAFAPPARALLVGIPATELMKVTRAWGMDVAKRKADLVDAVAGRLADPVHVRRVVSEAEPEVADVLLESVRRALDRARTAVWTADGTEAEPEADDAPTPFDPVAFRRERAAWAWAVEHGLAYPTEPYSTSVTFPAEVFVALAPPRFCVPFRAQPPAVPTAPVPPRSLASAAGGAVTEWLGAAMAVLELVAREPLTLLQSGGVGAREVQRVARSVGATTDDVRLVLEIATAVGLVTASGRSLVAATELAAWRGETPPQRARALLRAWFGLPTIATVDRHADGRTRPALTSLAEVRDPTGIRAVLVSAAADLDDGVGIASTDALVEAVRWRLPLAADPWSPEWVARTWAEAERLGVVVDGACTDIGRAVLRGGPQDLEAVLTSVLPAVQRRALIGSDLTVVVPGSPDPTVVDVLDAVAVREAGGAASTWRLTAASVREALDSGLTADAVLSALRDDRRDRAATRRLPRPRRGASARPSARELRGDGADRRGRGAAGRGADAPGPAAPRPEAGGADRARRHSARTACAHGTALGRVPAGRGVRRREPGGGPARTAPTDGRRRHRSPGRPGRT